MPREMKTYTGYIFQKGRQTRAVFCGTKKQLSEVPGMTMHYINNYWSETDNPDFVNAAKKYPGRVVWNARFRVNEHLPCIWAIDEEE